jgi:colicin import membrane protein
MPQSRKVYEAHLGFYDTVVAAFSQKSALAAWGSSTDLFRMGIARITNDPAKIKAALEKPGLVLRRPAGSDIPFSENPPVPKLPSSTAKRKQKRAS